MEKLPQLVRQLQHGRKLLHAPLAVPVGTPKFSAVSYIHEYSSTPKRIQLTASLPLLLPTRPALPYHSRAFSNTVGLSSIPGVLPPITTLPVLPDSQPPPPPPEPLLPKARSPINILLALPLPFPLRNPLSTCATSSLAARW